MWGLNQSDLKHILDYIYFGEVQLLEGELDKFLNVAKKLELDGAFQMGNLQEDASNNFVYIQEDGGEFRNLASELVPKNSESPTTLKSDPIEPPTIFKSDPVEPPTIFKSDPVHLAELDKIVSQSYFKTSDNLLQCKSCPKSFTSTSHAKDHAETHIEGINFPCKYCGKSFKNRHQRRGHESQERRRFTQKRIQNMAQEIEIPIEPTNLSYSQTVHEAKKLEILKSIGMQV